MREGAIDTNQTKRRPDVFSVRLRQRHRILAESPKACSLKRVCSTHGCNQEATTKSRPKRGRLIQEEVRFRSEDRNHAALVGVDHVFLDLGARERLYESLYGWVLFIAQAAGDNDSIGAVLVFKVDGVLDRI